MQLLYPPYFAPQQPSPIPAVQFAAAEAAYVAALPTTDPHVVGAEWNNGGIRAVSQG